MTNKGVPGNSICRMTSGPGKYRIDRDGAQQSDRRFSTDAVVREWRPVVAGVAP